MTCSVGNVVSAIVGALIGALISLIVDSALFEISVNGFFSIVFGICLLLIGGLILWRVSPEEGQTMNFWRIAVFIFSILVVASGIFCFVLEKDWIAVFSPKAKIPMYTVLGTSLSFSLSFSLVDLINQGVCECCLPPQSDQRLVKAIVQSPTQVYVILVASVSMGAVFGFNFGLLDVEDDNVRHTRFSKDQIASSIVGAVGGAIVGYLNWMLRNSEEDNDDGLVSSIDNHEDI